MDQCDSFETKECHYFYILNKQIIINCGTGEIQPTTNSI